MADFSQNSDKDTVHQFLRRYGRNSMSSLLLYEEIKYYFCDSAEAIIGYNDTSKLLIGIGEPICREEDYRVATLEFINFGKKTNKDCVFIMASEQFTQMVRDIGFLTIQIGEDFIYEVQTYAPRGNYAKKVRSATNQVRKRGAVVKEYAPVIERDKSLEDEFQTIANRWIKSHRFKSNAYLIGLKFFDFYTIKRYFYVEFENKIVAFLTCLPIYARNGYLFEDLIRDPSAPNGVSELMVLEAINKFKENGKSMATFGLSPKLETIGSNDLSGLSRVITNSTIKVINTVFRLRSLHHYRKKYHTEIVERCYLLKFPKRLRIFDIFGILRTFNIIS